MTSGLMRGKRGLIMGVANDHSIAWGIAKALAGEGADLAFTYQGEALGKRVSPLADSLGSERVWPCEVEDVSSLDTLFSTIAADWGSLDFLVHCIGFSDRNELKGRYADTSRDNFVRTMVISAFSFTEIVRRAAELMPSGGAMLTLTFGGSTRVMPNYNVMGIAKAALEASVRYLAADFGPEQHPRQRHLRRSDPHPCRGRHRRRAIHVQLPARAFAAPPLRHHRKRRRRGALPAFQPFGRSDGRNSLRRCRLQHHFDAASGRYQGLGCLWESLSGSTFEPILLTPLPLPRVDCAS